MSVTMYGNAQGQGQGIPAGGSTTSVPQYQAYVAPPQQQQPYYASAPQQVPQYQQPAPQYQQPQYQQPQPQYQQPQYQPMQYQQPAPQQQVGQPYSQPAPAPQVQQPSTVYGQQPVPANGDKRAQVEEFVTAAGLTATQVEQELSLTGTVSEATRRALVSKHGEGTTNLLVGSMHDMHKQAQATLAATNTAIYTQVAQAFEGLATPGQTGEQSWAELAQWVAANTTPDVRAAYNQMLNAGTVQAQLAVTQMINAFKTANGVGQPADLIVGGQQAPTQAALGVNDMTVARYSAELEKLVAQFGYESPQVAALNAQRDAARQRGIN